MSKHTPKQKTETMRIQGNKDQYGNRCHNHEQPIYPSKELSILRIGRNFGRTFEQFQEWLKQANEQGATTISIVDGTNAEIKRLSNEYDNLLSAVKEAKLILEGYDKYFTKHFEDQGHTGYNPQKEWLSKFAHLTEKE